MTAARPTARPRHEARQVLPPRGRELRAVCRAQEPGAVALLSVHCRSPPRVRQAPRAVVRPDVASACDEAGGTSEALNHALYAARSERGSLAPIMPRRDAAAVEKLGSKIMRQRAAQIVEAGKVSRCRGEPATHHANAAEQFDARGPLRICPAAPHLAIRSVTSASHLHRVGGKGGLGVDARQNHPRRCARTRTNARRTCRDAEPARGSSGTSGCSIPSSFEMPERATRA